MAKNTLRVQECVKDVTKTTEYIVTSVVSSLNASPTQIQRRCKAAWPQACYHYSSAIRVNTEWATLTCPPEAATTSREREKDSPAIRTWAKEHRGKGWKDPNCDRDEYPPMYLINESMVEWKKGGNSSKGQLVRFIDNKQNQNAGRELFNGICFKSPLVDLADRSFKDKVVLAPQHLTSTNVVHPHKTQTLAAITVGKWPEFTITAWDHAANPPVDDGLWDNSCWPQARVPKDPGFALLEVDPWNKATHKTKKHDWDYTKDYVPGVNGV